VVRTRHQHNDRLWLHYSLLRPSHTLLDVPALSCSPLLSLMTQFCSLIASASTTFAQSGNYCLGYASSRPLPCLFATLCARANAFADRLDGVRAYALLAHHQAGLAEPLCDLLDALHLDFITYSFGTYSSTVVTTITSGSSASSVVFGWGVVIKHVLNSISRTLVLLT